MRKGFELSENDFSYTGLRYQTVRNLMTGLGIFPGPVFGLSKIIAFIFGACLVKAAYPVYKISRFYYFISLNFLHGLIETKRVYFSHTVQTIRE